MTTNEAPRDAIGATDLWVPVDATDGDFYALGRRFGTQAGVLDRLSADADHAFSSRQAVGWFDPHALRWHRLQRPTPSGLDDNRLSIQVVNDYEGPYEDARPGDAPYRQAEHFTSINRSTREADLQGRVALPSSHRRIIDSEDERDALALTCRSVPLAVASAPDPDERVEVADLPDGVSFHEPGTTSGSHGSVTRTRPSVSIGGVTFIGQAAVDAAQEAFAQGGSAADAARWASAAARSMPRPPLLDAAGKVTGPTQERGTAPPPPETDPGGSLVPLLDHPAGYVWSLAGRVGLLGTLVCPEGAHGHYFPGRQGTLIGPLPLRHDAQVTMGPDLVGRLVFVSDDAAQVPEGTGKAIKGELWADTSRANQDTALGHETLQWRPVVRVDAALPPSKPPPDESWLDPGEDEDDEEDDEEEGGPKGGGPGGPPGGGGSPPGGPGQSSGEEPDTIGVTGPTPKPRQPPPTPPPGELPPVANAGSQVRVYSGTGVPCPNTTAGTLVSSTQVRIATGTGTTSTGGDRRVYGYPALSRVSGAVIVGGQEAPIPLGLPGPRGGGVVVEPGPDDGVRRGGGVPGDDPGRLGLGLGGGPPGGIDVEQGPDDGVPRGQPVPGDSPGRIPLGLPAPGGGGIGFEPGLGGDRGVPRGAGERAEAAERAARAARARAARDKAEQDEIERLRDLEQKARQRGQSNKGDRVQNRRERLERQRRQREDRQRKRDEYKERKKRERDERRRKREERRKKREEDRKRDDARRRRKKQDEEERQEREGKPPTTPQGGYMIDVTDGASEALTTGRLPDEERRRLEEDEKRRQQAGDSAFGDWNVANSPLPFFGAPGGPRTLEDWAHLTTFTVRAVQQLVNGAFGGPSYLAANLGLVHRNTVENPPTGSRVGAHWTVLPDQQDLQVCEGQAAVEVVSTLEAGPGQKICACSGAVLRVAREHVGQGRIDDLRPLVLLDNGDAGGREVRADLVSDLSRRVYVNAARALTATGLRAHVALGERGPALEVARVDPETRVVKEQLVTVNEQGTLRAHAGAHVARELVLEPGAALVLTGPNQKLQARVQLGGDGLRLSLVGQDARRSVLLSPKGLVVEGDLMVKGQLLHTS